MSNTFKIGDRVRVVHGEICKPSSEKAARILSGEIVGVIAGCNKKWSFVEFDGQTYPVPSENLKLAKTRRTFEEICNELAENTAISAEFRPVEVWSNFGDDPAIFVTDYCGEEGWEPIVIHRDGKAELNITLTPDQLAAIAAACTEIAANYAA